VQVSVSTTDLDGVHAIAVLLTDISERKVAEEALARSNRDLKDMVQELEHFSYTITHDMRAPLRAMHGLSKMLMEECGQCEQAERRDFLRRIADAATRMDNLITDALNYNRAMREHLQLEGVDAKALLSGMLESYPEFQAHRADIRIEGDIPILLGNKAGLTQCFSNLLSNAIKFVEPGKVPQIRIWAKEEGEWVRLHFKDNGIGIPKQYQEQVWEMFKTLSKKYEGTGIGLALVRKVMSRMGGKVGLRSEPGDGSCFWLELKRYSS
jgi:signal transduction histidine kinase